MSILTIQCPTCGRTAVWHDNPSRPFCSDRCKLIDLGNWSAESYRLPVTDSGRTDQEVDDDDSTPE